MNQSIPPAELRPGDVYLVAQGGKATEAQIVTLRISQGLGATGDSIVAGRRGSFWISPDSAVTVICRDPAYASWRPAPEAGPDPAGRPPCPPHPEDALAFDPGRFHSAFDAHGAAGSYETGTWKTCAGRTDIAILHAEYPATGAGWDLPGHLPWLEVARTPCLATDLTRPDDTATGRPDLRAYLCRLGHEHGGGVPARDNALFGAPITPSPRSPTEEVAALKAAPVRVRIAPGAPIKPSGIQVKETRSA